MLSTTLRKLCHNLMQYTKVNDLTWMHTLFPWPPKANLLDRKLIILLIRDTQQYLLKFINSNLSMAVCLLTVAPSFQ